METLSRKEVQEIQLRGIQDLLQRAYARSSFYREHLQRAGVRPEDIRSLEDFSERVPFLTKQDLVRDQQDNPPYGARLLVDGREVWQVHTTTGTSGMGQEAHALTREDADMVAESLCYSLTAQGMEPGDVVALLWPVATMAGGLTAEMGLRHYGCNTMLLQIFDSKTRISFMQKFSPHAIWATPAYLTRVTYLCQDEGIVPKRDFPRLKCIVLSTGAFPVSWAERMEDFWGCQLHDIYGATQTVPWLAYTCEKGVIHQGQRSVYHFPEHLAYVEVIDPATGRQVAYGEEGEPVFTTFCRQAVPLIRFRTNDKVRLLAPDSCDCGRTVGCWEVGTITRYDEMLKIKGQNVWPSAVDEVLFAGPEIDEYRGRVFIDQEGKEQAKISLEFRRDLTDPERKQQILRELPEIMKRKIGVSVDFEEVPFGTIPRVDYKVRRWTDERETGLERVEFLEKK
jgi:phenylacetate-CoA ligase